MKAKIKKYLVIHVVVEKDRDLRLEMRHRREFAEWLQFVGKTMLTGIPTAVYSCGVQISEAS